MTNTLIEQAFSRGYSRGLDDDYAGIYNEAPLSGEWAGESIEELLGDLIRRAENTIENGDDFYETYNEILDAYEEGYRGAHFDKEQDQAV